MVVSAVFFLSMLLLGRPGTTSAEPHPNANLVNVVATFSTTNDNKDSDTRIWVSVYNNGAKIAGWEDWNHKSGEYRDWETNIVKLWCRPIEYKDVNVNNLNVGIMMQAYNGLNPLAPGNDKWKFYADVVLTFSDGTRIGLRSPNEIVLNSTWEQSTSSTEQFVVYDPEAREKARRRTGR